MADENLGKQVWPPQPQDSGSDQLGTGEGESPLASLDSKIDLRTMTSDLSSMQESGEGLPRPYTPPPSVTPTSPETPASVQEQKTPPTSTPPQIETMTAAPAQLPVEPTTEPKSKKGLFVILLTVVVLIGVGAVAYFFVYPFFFGAEEVAQAPSVPVAETPSPPPSIPEILPVPEETPPVAEPESPPPPASLTHVSLLKTAADLAEEITLTAVDLPTLKKALEFNTTEVPVFKEIVLKDAAGNLVVFETLMNVFMPGAFTSEVLNSLEKDFTAVLYTNSKGSWPVYAVKTKEASVSPELQTKIGQLIESNADLANLFLAEPGNIGVWKDGKTGETSNRYVMFSNAGFGLNYGWVRNTLVLSASYDGFKETIKRFQ